jgi:DNA-binding beta-propeller fold protein YncE
MPKFRWFLLAAAMAAPVSFAAAAPTAHYAVTGSINGPDGGWDYASVDSAARQVYVARADSITAIDLAHGRAVRSFGAISRGHAVVPIPGTSILLVTSGRDDSVRLFDRRSGRETARLAAGGNPDSAFYDPATHRAYVINARSGSVSVVDPARAKIDATVALKPGLEFAVAAGGTLFINSEEANEIETVDLASRTAGAPIALPGCQGPSGLGYDPQSGRLISACANGKAAVVGVRSRKLEALLDIGKGPDAVVMDAGRRRAFIPCGRDGVLEVIALGLGVPKVIDHVKTEAGARTGAVDTSDGTLYLPTARFGPPAAPGGRPSAIAGSFHVLIVSRR